MVVQYQLYLLSTSSLLFRLNAIFLMQHLAELRAVVLYLVNLVCIYLLGNHSPQRQFAWLCPQMAPPPPDAGTVSAHRAGYTDSEAEAALPAGVRRARHPHRGHRRRRDHPPALLTL